MADNRNFAALDWLIHEIGETLKEARQALEAYVENPKDTVRIRFCLTHIHQVHGSLQMVEFFGAAMLAEEMERLTQAMIQNTVANTSEAHEVLMRAILQFPVYLDQVKATRKDNPLIVLPLLNDLRAVRGESLLTDTKLFVPNLAPAKKVVGARSAAAQDNVQFQAMALKLRQMYQYAAAGFIRNVNSDENLAYLQKVFNRLHKLTQGTARHALWDICLALAEALEIDAIEISVAIKNLLRQLDKEIKILAVHGTKALNSYTNDELIKNLLYYVARAGKHAPGFSENSHLQRIYETYHLNDALIEGKESGEDSSNILSAPDPDAMRSVVEALKTELDVIKHALDVCISGGDAQQTLTEALPVIKRIGDTMAVLGLGDLRKQVLEQGAVLELVKNSDSELSGEQLMAVASKIIQIENSLDSLAQSHVQQNVSAPSNEGDITLSRAKESVLRESRNGLEHAKDAIIEYIASQWDRTHLQNVPDTLREIRGGLEIMPLPRAARILGACARYIDEQLLAQEFAPQWSTLDTLADAITSVEYYLERLSSGATKEENDLLLTVAEESVAALGYAVAKTSRPENVNSELPALREAALDEVAVTEESAEADEANLSAAYQSALSPVLSEKEPEAENFDAKNDQIENVNAEGANTQSSAESETKSETAPPNLFNQYAPSLENKYPRPETAITISPVISGDLLVTFNSAHKQADDIHVNEEVGNEETSPVGVSAEHELDNNVAELSATDAYVEETSLGYEIDSTENEIAPFIQSEAAHIDTTSTSLAVENNSDDENYIDDEIIEIFVEEAGEVSEAIGEYFPRWANNFDDENSLIEFRRAFHTLKGSGRMVGANDIGELAWSIENMLNRILDKTIVPQHAHVVIIEKVRAILPGMIEAFSLHHNNPHPTLTEHYRTLAEGLAKGIVADELLETGEPAIDNATEALHEENNKQADEQDIEELSIATEDDHYDHAIAEENIDAAMSTVSIDEVMIDENADDADIQLWDIFGAEALTHLQVVEEFIAYMEAEAPCYEPPSDSIQRALHTLKGSAHMAEITPIAELAAPLEKFVKELRSYHVNINDDILQLLRDGVSYTHAALKQIEQNENVEIPRLQQFIARVNELRDIHVTPLVRQQELDENGKRPVDPELLSIFMAEEMNLLLDADKIIAQWQEHPHNVFILKPILDELRNLTRGAHHAYLSTMADLGEQLDQVYVQIIDKNLPCSALVCDTILSAHIALLDMVDAVAAGQNLVAAPQPIQQGLQDLLTLATHSEAAESIPEDSTNDESNEGVLAELPLLEIEEDIADTIEDVANDTIESNIETIEIDINDDSIAFEEISLDYADLPVIENIEDAAVANDEVISDAVSADEENIYDESTHENSDDDINLIDSSSEDATQVIGEELNFGSTLLEEKLELEEELEPAEELDAIPILEVVTLEDDDELHNADFNLQNDIDIGEEITLDADSESDLVLEDLPVIHKESDNEESKETDRVVFDGGDEYSEEFIAEASEVHDTEIPLPETDDVIDDEIIISEDAIQHEPTDEHHVDEELADIAAITAAENEILDELVFAENEPEEIEIESVPAPAPVSPPAASRPKIAVVDDEDFDPEIIEIFLEEAGELLEDMERSLHEWQEDWNNLDSVEELKRCLHTFKGGARLAGLTDLGDLSHDFETVLIDMNPDQDIDQAFFKHLNSFQDRLHAGVDQTRAKLSGDFANEEYAEEEFDSAELDGEDIIQAVDQVEEDDIASESAQHSSVTANDDHTAVPTRPTLVVDNSDKLLDPENPGKKPNVLTFAPKAKPAAAPLPKIPGAEYGGMKGSGTGQVQHLAARRTGPQEVVKVSAELLEELVNLAGETSISRGRMEQQVSDLSGSIEEMDATIHRLQEQLRRLDIETEAQVLFRQEQMAQHEEFDPLEMDRYSQLQQLSRSLIESASDLMDLKYTLADKTRDTETLLLQQSRINTDLQEGLMRSRMVPFSRLVPRLRRIVRQAATELNKDVDFELDNVEGELDRTVLERMVAPLEHMLRNAVDHGIESPEARAEAGKPAIGRITLTLGREGGDVILRLSDDGRGINLQRVREKAIERGLMSEDAQLSDQDLMQFILHAGFSTADKITQISGRGVGMDVVHSEIKQLGGAMFIDSRWGEGTQFIIRLPFTVSVNRALMVQIGDDLYAIPLNTIEGIVRVSPFELEHYYQDEDARFDYAGEHYHVRYLGAMLESDAKPKLDGQSLPLPVVLVRSAENTVALQVDRLLGSREIVVKTLGAQFSAVRGVSGATVMGDGSVVVILDLHALIREQIALGLGRTMLLEPLHFETSAEEDQAEKVVMVVDDSVTVRKVTGRFLEREGFRVIAAKDGVEALQLLQDHMPDVMLLDIEMPRMDGFEVAKNIRTSSRLKDIPIIMITSRTGEKHRERAFELGVNKYMGKPYQEDLLLSNIQELIKKPVT